MILTDHDLLTYYSPAASLQPGERALYLARANAYAAGVIGGEPTTVDENLKAAVALAFEIMVKGNTAQVDQTTGYITDAAAPSQAGYPFQRSQTDPLQIVKDMLQPYVTSFAQANATKSERGVRFL